MDLITAYRAKRIFGRYKKLVVEYYKSTPFIKLDHRNIPFTDIPSQGEELLKIRSEINMHFKEVDRLANELGIHSVFQQYPAPAIGGPVVPMNVFNITVEEDLHHEPVPRTVVIDTIDHCIGAANEAFWKAIIRTFFPLFWIIDVPALFVKIPFLIMRKAGVPPKVEENIISNVFKVSLVVVIYALLTYFGLKEIFPNILGVIGK